MPRYIAECTERDAPVLCVCVYATHTLVYSMPDLAQYLIYTPLSWLTISLPVVIVVVVVAALFPS